MTPDNSAQWTNADLIEWRLSLGWLPGRAAKELGMAPKPYQELERGSRFDNGKPTSINRRTELACKYLTLINKSS